MTVTLFCHLKGVQAGVLVFADKGPEGAPTQMGLLATL